MKISVTSLYDGISCGMVALRRNGIQVSSYHASEIDKYAIKVSNSHFPDIIRMVDAMEIKEFPKTDLLLGGSPCTFWSIARKDREIDKEGIGWKLFMQYKKAQKHSDLFLYENVASMPTQIRDYISEELGVEPILIDSALVSAQQRKRLYWTNIKGVRQPEDRKIYLKDIVMDGVFPVALHNLYGGFKEKQVRVFTEKSPTLRTPAGGGHIPSLVKESLIHSPKAIEYMNRQVADGRTHWDFGYIHDIRDEKSKCLVANLFNGVPYNVFKDWDCIRKFHPVECERLMGLDDGFCSMVVSPTQAYKQCGNGWQIDTVAHILSYM